jgi:hypothetical protein
MGAKRDGPGIAWSCLERENSKVVLTSDMAEKCQSIESLFHRPIFWMSARYSWRNACAVTGQVASPDGDIEMTTPLRKGIGF